MQQQWLGVLGATLLGSALVSAPVEAQTSRGPYARIAVMRALDGHGIEFEAGYIRHLEWHRQVKDPFNWYSYSVWASTERQRWIVYATFGHSAASLANPIRPVEDERDNLVNVLPHTQFLGNWVYEYLPSLSRGDGHGMPTPSPSAELTTIDVNIGAAAAFESALLAAQPKLAGETLWYRLVVGGRHPRYVRLRPRASLAAILEQSGDQAVPEKVHGLISVMTVEILSLRPTMLVNVVADSGR
jgi:hypothetical protein